MDKPFSRQIELVTRHWSGKHHRVVQGINLMTLLSTDGDRYIPCDYLLYNKAQDGLTKNDRFQQMNIIHQKREKNQFVLSNKVTVL